MSNGTSELGEPLNQQLGLLMATKPGGVMTCSRPSSICHREPRLEGSTRPTAIQGPGPAHRKIMRDSSAWRLGRWCPPPSTHSIAPVASHCTSMQRTSMQRSGSVQKCTTSIVAQRGGASGSQIRSVHTHARQQACQNTAPAGRSGGPSHPRPTYLHVDVGMRQRIQVWAHHVSCTWCEAGEGGKLLVHSGRAKGTHRRCTGQGELGGATGDPGKAGTWPRREHHRANPGWLHSSGRQPKPEWVGLAKRVPG